MEGGRLHKSSSLLQPRPNPFVTLDFFKSLLKFLFEIRLKLYISLREVDIVTILSLPNDELDTCFPVYLDPL